MSHLFFGWEEPVDLQQEYERTLRKIAFGEFQNLKNKVESLEKKIRELSALKKVLITEEALLEVWDNEEDDWWDEI